MQRNRQSAASHTSRRVALFCLTFRRIDSSSDRLTLSIDAADQLEKWERLNETWLWRRAPSGGRLDWTRVSDVTCQRHRHAAETDTNRSLRLDTDVSGVVGWKGGWGRKLHFSDREKYHHHHHYHYELQRGRFQRPRFWASHHAESVVERLKVGFQSS